MYVQLCMGSTLSVFLLNGEWAQPQLRICTCSALIVHCGRAQRWVCTVFVLNSACAHPQLRMCTCSALIEHCGRAQRWLCAVNMLNSACAHAQLRVCTDSTSKVRELTISKLRHFKNWMKSPNFLCLISIMQFYLYCICKQKIILYNPSLLWNFVKMVLY